MSSSSYLCGRGQRCVCALCVCLGPSLNFLPRLWPALSVWQQVRQWSQQHSYSASWSEEVGNGASPLPTSGQAVVRVGWGWGGCRTHLWIIITLINTLSLQTLTRLLLSDPCSFCESIYILLRLRACLHTYSDRVVTRSGHCSALSDLTSLSVSVIWPETTPLPVHVRMHVWKLAVSPRSNRKAETLQNTQLSAVSPLWTLLRRRRVRDVFHCKLQFNVVKFFTLFARSASGGTEEANTFQWKLIYAR